jgi:hypothetical protein
MKFILLLIILVESNSFYIPNHHDKELNNIAFGSCFYGRESKRLDIFEKILSHKPEMWMWTGDASYVDELIIFDYWKSTIEVDFEKSERIFNECRNEQCTIKIK